MNRYPYFLYPAICELRNNPAPETANRLKEFLAANIGDREALLTLTGSLDSELIDFYPEPSGEIGGTDSTIDCFISKFSNGATPFVPQVLRETAQGDSPEPSLSADDAREKNAPEPIVDIDNPEEAMETARLMVKNRDYDGALAIMEAIYLNNPKKSVYFADQIRFVRKLKLNASKK